MKIKHYQVISNYESAYPDPLVFSKGEMLKIGTETSDWPGWVWVTNKTGKSGWIPLKNVKKIKKNLIKK